MQRIDRADRAFSLYIREKHDHTCQRCGYNDPDVMQTSHYFTRSNEATRFYVPNVDCLCLECHDYFGKRKKAYKWFKIERLGADGYKILLEKSNGYKKKDRKSEAKIWADAYKELCRLKDIVPKRI